MRLRACALGLVLVLGAACRAPLGPAVPLAPGDPRPRVLLDALARTAQERHALRAVARIALDGPGGSGRAKQILVAARPARLRVEVLGFLNQTAAVLVTDGERYHLLRASDRAVAEGPVTPELLADVAGIALTPEEAVDVLLGAPTVPEPLELRRALRLGDGTLRIALGGGGGLRWQLDFDATGALRGLSVDRRNEPGWSARFDDYREVSGGPFPHRIALRFEASGAEATIDFSRVELNPPLSDAVFALPRRAANAAPPSGPA